MFIIGRTDVAKMSVFPKLIYGSALGFLWKEWCWGWNPNTLATLCEELTHWKRLWCWEGLGARGEGDDRGWDGWMQSLTRWTWVSVNSGSWWWTERPGVLRFMGSQRVGHDWVTDLIWSDLNTITGFPGGSEVKASACNAGDLGSTPGLGRSPGEGNGNALRYSCLENPMDGGAWWATVHGVAKSWIRLISALFAMTLPQIKCQYNMIFWCSEQVSPVSWVSTSLLKRSLSTEDNRIT